jgi:hypothetical protein
MPGLGPEGGRGAPFGNIAERVLRAASSDEFRAWNPETFMCGSGLAWELPASVKTSARTTRKHMRFLHLFEHAIYCVPHVWQTKVIYTGNPLCCKMTMQDGPACQLGFGKGKFLWNNLASKWSCCTFFSAEW